ncbi:malto-oligosyltrehalose synthase [Pontibacter akesuensis]|uniref:Maltooligosyl trehalose synthase n=1 Tax=Pontibacter akesuensis TaxID=388950 RepID=A0A1I7KES9_9BACT|nr:malto-oligosyltrehalose synthase [Pontibacter akesuensis]GHA79696.1 malto-oligosyltrehalose synthase [Pontibacter akesuensis]SFU96011.1 maltooligosyl trehalose synthase [Pontibacter akesuensis]
MTYIPSATYRVQTNPNFKLSDIRQIVPYLHELGVSTVYSAPFFSARPGSEHGYDVTAAYEISPEIGTKEELQEIARELKNLNMGWLQDIVPNHMAYHPNNVWLMDVLEKGPQSHFYTFFDIDFSHPDFNGQVMVPFLGDPLDKVLENKQLEVKISEQGISVFYYESGYPLSVGSYRFLLQEALQNSGNPEVTPQAEQLLRELTLFEEEKTISPAAWSNFKKKVYKTAAVRQALEQLLADKNQEQEKLQKLLNRQHFILCHWQETEKVINFRRFFTVNDLICLSMEHPEVFEQYHQFIKQLCEQGMLQGLRVDHVDGLFDPTTYLKRLRQLVGPEQYLVVEKILEGEEQLPERWPIQGNSGYDFLAWVSNLYTSGKGRRQLTEIYRRLIPNAPTNYEQLVYDKKMFILTNYMQGELENLLRLLQERKLIPLEPKDTWRKALATLLTAWPIYCIYGNRLPLSKHEMHVVDEAFAEAHKKAPGLEEQLNHLHTLFTVTPEDTDESKRNKLYFVMRSQQFTGPLAAKGVEDTSFYNYNRLISLNEVGNSPDIFHLEDDEYHERMLYRQRTYPHSINATATHDTKRGEGARMRLNVLSEVAQEWDQHVQQWLEITKKYTTEPTRNDLYFLLQTLIGVLPMGGEVDESLIQRVQEYLEKALREAKVNTDWSAPNETYEQAMKGLVHQLLQQDEDFMHSFQPFFLKLAHYGWIYSLCQSLLKITSPGVPDIYQGTEFWDLSLVDPDNRRPVDYDQRHRYLKQLKQQEQQDIAQLHEELLQHPEDARVKLYLLHKALTTRRELQTVFDKGDYIPLQVQGAKKDHLLAFARHHEGQWVLVAVPLLLVSLVSSHELPLGEEVWGDTSIQLPDFAPQVWQPVLGKGEVNATDSLSAAAIFKTFPVALLTAKNV